MTVSEIFREWKRGCGNTVGQWPIWCWPCTWGAIRAAALRLVGRWPPPPPTLSDLLPKGIDYSKPVHVPDEWVTWPGKERGEPKPPIIWADTGPREAVIEIQTVHGYAKLLTYPTSVRVTDVALTAEVLEEPGIPSFDALMSAWREGRMVMFRVDGAEMECRVMRLSEPTLEPRKAMTRMMELRQPKRP